VSHISARAWLLERHASNVAKMAQDEREQAVSEPETYTEPCDPWRGDAAKYQAQAFQALHDAGVQPAHYSWITPRCSTGMCLQPDHLLIHAPTHIEYPYGVCIYCGRRGWTKDHLLPQPLTGNTMRRFVATVPACGECNSLLRDTFTASVTERRELAQIRLRRKHRKVLRNLDFTEQQLDEFGQLLRDYIVASMALKAEILALFDWPTDPAYDERAFQKSGIDDPYAAGFLHGKREAA